MKAGGRVVPWSESNQDGSGLEPSAMIARLQTLLLCVLLMGAACMRREAKLGVWCDMHTIF